MQKSYVHALGNPDIQKKQLDFVKYAFGHMTLTYTETTLEVHGTEEIEVIIEGKNYPFTIEASMSPITYRKCTSELIEVEYEYYGITDVYEYSVVNENLFWVELDSGIGREYFYRVK